MKRLSIIFLPLLLLELLPSLTMAQSPTPVGGTINGNAIWTKANSPYVMVANIVVPSGMSLTVQAGVEVKAFGNTQLATSGGTISLNGTANEPISFTAADTVVAWHGIYLHSGGTLTATFAHFTQADTAIRIKANASANTSFQDCQFQDNGVGIAAQRSFTLNASTLRENTQAGIALTGSFPFVATGNTLCNYPINLINYTDSIATVSNTCWCTADTALIGSSLKNQGQGAFDYLPIDNSCLPDLVFIGDTDHNGAVSTADLLPIGLRYGDTGPARTAALPPIGATWVGVPATAWADTLPNGINLQNVDCNGDGSINETDADVLMQRYDRQWSDAPLVPATGAGLFFDMQAAQTFTAGDTVLIPVELQPTSNLYGMSFSILLDTAMLQKSPAGYAPIQVQYYGTWFGAVGTDVLARSATLPSKGRVDIGMVRKDKTPRTGGGKVADIIVVLDDHIAKTNALRAFLMQFANVQAIDVAGNTLAVGGETHTVEIQTTGADAQRLKEICLYPNPAHHECRISAQGLRIRSATLLNTLGVPVAQHGFSPEETHYTLPLHDVPQGWYVVRLETDEGIVFRALTIE